MHTLYMVYDGNDNVTDFAIDGVPSSQNFISLDRGPLSYIQSIVDNLNAYIKKNGSLKVDNAYIGQIRHGQFDETYGKIQDKYTNNPNYTFHGNTQQPTQPTTQPTEPQPAESSEPVESSEASSTATPASSAPASSVSTPTSTPSK